MSNLWQGKMKLFRVSGEFELSEFELSEFELVDSNWLKPRVKAKGN